MASPDSQAGWIHSALDRYERPLVRYAAGLLGDAERARDVVQDTFLRLCKADRGKLDGQLGPWLYTVCRNRAFDVRRKEGRMSVVETHRLDEREGNGRAPDLAAEQQEDEDAVLRVVATLPERQQEALRLKFQHGMTYREIAAIMDLPLSTVSHTITQALRTLRAQLRGHVNRA